MDWIDAATPGLSLRVTPAGARTWYALYKKGRTARRVKIGRWPGTSLAKARRLARESRQRVETEGADPAKERQADRDVFLVSDLTELYLTLYAKPKKRTWKHDEWGIDRYVLPSWGSRPVREIRRTDAHALLDKIVAAGKPIQANRIQSLLSKLWNFAIDRSHAEINPCHRMPKHAPEQVRDVVLDDEALRGLWAALDAQPGDAADALRLRLLTGQRGGEVHGMAWADVDLEENVWTIPAAQAKNGRLHRVPLSTPAVAVLTARLAVRPKKEPRVFPGLYHQRDDLRALAAIHDGAYKWHDLRRTVATRLARLGYAEEVIGRVLNHARRGITGRVYNQHAYDLEKRTALDAWARRLAELVAAKPSGGTVVPFVR